MSGPLGVEGDILDRLEDQVGPLACVASGAAISALGLSVGDLALPLVVVEPRETEVSDQAGRGVAIIEDQEWLVSIVARHTADRETLRADYTSFDTLIVTVIRALTGWQPPTGLRELRYRGREDFIHEPGLLEVGLTFSTFYHLSAATQ